MPAIPDVTPLIHGKHETARLPVRTSSAQAQAVYLPSAAPGLGDSGVIIGREVYSGKGYIYDPFCLYGSQLPAPHWLVLGESGNGKSSLEKTYVLRQLRFRDRQVVVLDAQGEDGVGEWDRLSRSLGITPIRLDPSGGVRLNPLDPRIAPTGQLALLRTIIEVATGRPLDERSGYAVKVAHATVRARVQERQPLLSDIVIALRAPEPTATAEMDVTVEDVRAWGLDVALVLDRLVDGDLAGMFDAPTTDAINLRSPLIVFDLSGIDRNSIAMPILMAVVGVWLEHTWLRPDRCKRILLVEEAWHIINSPRRRATLSAPAEVRPTARFVVRRRRPPPLRRRRRRRCPRGHRNTQDGVHPDHLRRRPTKRARRLVCSACLAGPWRSSPRCRRERGCGTSTATSRSLFCRSMQSMISGRGACGPVRELNRTYFSRTDLSAASR